MKKISKTETLIPYNAKSKELERMLYNGEISKTELLLKSETISNIIKRNKKNSNKSISNKGIFKFFNIIPCQK